MDKILNYYKPKGVTPYQLLQLVRKKVPQFSLEKITYVGRLDPLAEGVQLYLRQPNVASINKVKGWPKEYQVSMLLGLSTDTYDVLGKLTQVSTATLSPDHIVTAQDVLSKYHGEINQDYPPYSGVKVNGKALHEWARLGKIDTIAIPSHQVTIKNLTITAITQISGTSLIKTALNSIELVKGNFRQPQITQNWYQYQDLIQKQHYWLVHFTINCSSGTYVRQICHEVGTKLGVGALAWNIKRTKVGSYTSNSSITLNLE